jgi:3-phosphoshikimate 1-carboxyvinyltransferase
MENQAQESQMKEIQPKNSIDARVRAPGSKSLIHRALVASGLAVGTISLSGFLKCEDTLYTADALQGLGVGMVAKEEDLTVDGRGGEFPIESGIRQIYMGNSGTSYRLLLSVLSLSRGQYILTGTSRMLERPISGLVQALKELGADVSCIGGEGVPPVLVKGKGIRGGKIEISGDRSSQYVSSLLLAGPYMEDGVDIKVKGSLVSKPYVDLTVDVMERFGVSVFRDGYDAFKVCPDQRYRPCHLKVEGDVSSASYFWAAAAVTGGKVTTENIYPLSTKQGDINLLRILERMGCTVYRGADHVAVEGGPLFGIDVDMSEMPDMVPTVAAIALFADGKTRIRNVAHLRYKESNRLQSIAVELDKIGGRIEELSDGLEIHGGSFFSGAVLDPHNDHRIAMGLAVVGLRVPGIRIKEESCVNKSFPGFWELWDRI